MKKVIFYFIVLSVLLASCTNISNSANETKEQTVFKSDEVGWTVAIPDGWNVISNEELAENAAKGKEYLKNEGKQISTNNETVILFVARKGEVSRFQAAATPFKSEDTGIWQDSYKILRTQIFEAFMNPKLGISADSTSSKTKIDNLDFEVFKVGVYHENKLIMTQVMYRRLINEYDFAITTTYDKETHKNEIKEALNSSKFHR